MDLTGTAHLRALVESTQRYTSSDGSASRASRSDADDDDIKMATDDDDIKMATDDDDEQYAASDEDLGEEADEEDDTHASTGNAHYHYHNPEIYHQHHHIAPHHGPVHSYQFTPIVPAAMSDDMPADDANPALSPVPDAVAITDVVAMLTGDMDDMDDMDDALDTFVDHFATTAVQNLMNSTFQHFMNGTVQNSMNGTTYFPPSQSYLMQHAALQASLAAGTMPNMLSSLPDSMPSPSTMAQHAPPTMAQHAPPTEMDMPGMPEWPEEALHPTAASNPNPHMLSGTNVGLFDFLHHWARLPRRNSVITPAHYPWPIRINDMVAKPVKKVQYAELKGDRCDMQGINWADLGVTRKEARERRLLTYQNYVSVPESDRWMPHLRDMAIPRTESFFRFRRMDIRRDVALSHFQLRNILAVTSRTGAFYPGIHSVYQFNPVSGQTRTVMKLQDTPGSQVSTIAANHGVLIAGLFNGEFLLRRLDADESDPDACGPHHHHGVLTTNPSGITNHVQIYTARTSSSPHAAFSSNDQSFRVLDLAAQKTLSISQCPFPLNCSAVSPDGRLRVIVGDDRTVLITAADGLGRRGGDFLYALGGHRDYGFACDWADDGWTVATGFQDKTVKIWDARRFTDTSGYATPVCTLRSEMAGVRSLRFSPAGSGRRVLVAAEEADYVSIIDAQTFQSKQTIDIFGEIGGVAFSNGGQELSVLCCDPVRGGLLQLERCGMGGEAAYWEVHTEPEVRGQSLSWDWRRTGLARGRRVEDSVTRRRRRGADRAGMEPF